MKITPEDAAILQMANIQRKRWPNSREAHLLDILKRVLVHHNDELETQDDATPAGSIQKDTVKPSDVYSYLAEGNLAVGATFFVPAHTYSDATASRYRIPLYRFKSRGWKFSTALQKDPCGLNITRVK